MSQGSRTLVVLVALAVSLGGSIPEPHAHFDRAGAIVHAHAVADLAVHHDDVDGDSVEDHHQSVDDHHQSTVEHGDHAAAKSLRSSYDLRIRFALTTDAGAAVIAVDQAATPSLCKWSGGTLLPTHDPPLRFNSSPAPPAIG